MNAQTSGVQRRRVRTHFRIENTFYTVYRVVFIILNKKKSQFLDCCTFKRFFAHYFSRYCTRWGRDGCTREQISQDIYTTLYSVLGGKKNNYRRVLSLFLYNRVRKQKPIYFICSFGIYLFRHFASYLRINFSFVFFKKISFGVPIALMIHW